MPKYSYLAKNKKGKEEKETVEASSEKEVVSLIRERGFWPVYVEEIKIKKIKKFGFFRDKKIPLKEKMIFCRHLGVMVSSGLSVSNALDVLGGHEKNKNFKKVINSLSEGVKKGTSLADAMEKHPKAFDKIFVSMVKVGETGGSLEEILNILSSQLEKDHKLISKMRGALIYPAIIIGVMVIIAILMMMFVIPKITEVFEDFGAELPFLTRVVIAISNFMSHNILVTFGIISITILGIIFFYKTEIGVKIFHKIFIKFPVIKTLVIKLNSARFARILSSLLKSGVSLVEGLKITSDTLGNYYFKKTIKEASEEVQKGKDLSEILSKNDSDTFPFLVIKMLKVGEDTGKTPDILEKLAEFYEEEVSQMTQNLSSIIEPFLMVLIGTAVAFFAVAIIKPIYSLMQLV